MQLRDWLAAFEVELVGMEPTGVYWKPLYYMLDDQRLRVAAFSPHPSSPHRGGAHQGESYLSARYVGIKVDP